MDRSIKPHFFRGARLAVGFDAGHVCAGRKYLPARLCRALLDNRYAGPGLKALAADAAGRVTLGARSCLGPSQKRDIELLLQQTGKVNAVAWDASTDCDATPVATPPEPASTPARVDIRPLPERELFVPLIADPRQPRFSMNYQHYNMPSRRFNAAAVAFGEYFGFAQGSFGERGTSQIGIQGALFNLDAPSSTWSTPTTGSGFRGAFAADRGRTR